MIRNKNIVVFGLQSWDLTKGSNCKNIAMQFAENNKVLYVNRPFTRMTFLHPKKGYKKEDVIMMKTYRINVKKGKINPIQQIQGNLWVLTLPIETEPIQWIGSYHLFQFVNKFNNKKIAKNIIKFSKKLGFDNFILFIDSAMFQGFYLKELLMPEKFVYYIRDYLICDSYFKKHGTLAEKKIIQKADVVVANSTFLANYAKQFNSNSHYVGQGCDLSIFQPDKIDIAHPLLQNIKHPIIGYVGLLTTDRLDLDLLVNLSKTKPEWSFVLVGPEDEFFENSELHSLSNVHFLGFQKMDLLPQFIYGFDICMNPQVINQMTIGNYPRKIDEYLAMGKPVIATKTEAMDIFKDYVKLASNKEDYLLKIQELLDDNNPDIINKRIQFANSHTWENSVNAIGKAVLSQGTSPDFKPK